MNNKVEEIIKETCIGISLRYDIHFLEVGTDQDHVHFLIQTVPMMQPTKLVRTIKSITAREVFALAPEVKKELWGGEFWSDGYFISTVGKNGSEGAIQTYVKNQGRTKEYQIITKDKQMKLF